MTDRDSPAPPSSRDVAGEDFLFHLYRGSELLQDNRVHEAKTELENALALQPSDPKGQDLLGIVYFRLGMYPRAIAIYERLVQLHPSAVEPRINLALSYLKTGQPAQARAELEKVLEQSPSHSRAWAYLGLAFKAMGDYERASHAFAAGGHDLMARRLVEMAMTAGSLTMRPEGASLARSASEVRRSGGESFQELDREGASLRAEPEIERTGTGSWASIEAGREPMRRSIPEPASGEVAQGVLRQPSLPAFSTTAPPKASELARERLLVFPRDLAVALHASGLVLVRSPGTFAARLEVVRSLTFPAGWTCALLPRRARGRTLDEPLGGAASGIVELRGSGELVLGPTVGHQLQPLVVDGDPVYLREDVVSGFEGTITYENGRLAVGDGESIGMLQLRGPGVVVAQLPDRSSAVEVPDGRSVVLRALMVLGWIGRIIPRALLPSEAPAGVRGFVSLAGEGMVFVDAR
jgi:thioredoxin-like negative regulator of GroEL